MLLAIDIGNTNICTGLYDGEKLRFVSSFQTVKRRSSDQLAIDILNIFALNKESVESIDGAIISSVVPSLTQSVADAVKKLAGVTAIIMGPGVKTGLNIKTEIHTQVGTDIVAAAVGTLHKYSLPAIIIDMGTATIISAVSESGEFLGCSIAPGIGISLESLAEHTAQLTDISLEKPEKAIGKNTVDSMRSGIILGTVGMVDSMIELFKKEMGDVKSIIATGYYSERIAGCCLHNIKCDPNLIMDGMLHIYVKNLNKNWTH